MVKIFSYKKIEIKKKGENDYYISLGKHIFKLNEDERGYLAFLPILEVETERFEEYIVDNHKFIIWNIINIRLFLKFLLDFRSDYWLTLFLGWLEGYNYNNAEFRKELEMIINDKAFSQKNRHKTIRILKKMI